MGWPALIGLALSAAGTGVGAVANANTARAENNTVNDELNAQRLLQQKSTNIFNQNLNQGNSAADANSQIGATQAAQNKNYAALNAQPATGGQSPVSIDPVVQARADASTQQQGNNSAKLQGYSQWGVNQAIQNMLAGQQLGLVNNQSQQLASTLGPRLQQAGQAYSGLSGVGSLLGTLGSAVGVGGSVAGWGQPGVKKPVTPIQNPTSFFNAGTDYVK